MKCFTCGATGSCFFNAARKLVCRACRDAEQDELRLAQMTAKYVGKTGMWSKPTNYHTGSYEDVPVTIIGLKLGKTAWLIAQDREGVEHRVKSHNVAVMGEPADYCATAYGDCRLCDGRAGQCTCTCHATA